MLNRHEHSQLAYYTFPHLALPGVHHAISTRLGGFSHGPYASLNLSYSVGDDPPVVAGNRRRFYAAIGVLELQVVSSHQVHSVTVQHVTAGARGRGAISPGSAIPATDGLVTAERGVYLFMRFADCVPILLYDPVRQAVAMLHAGWRGTVGMVAGIALQTMSAAFGSRPADVLAAIGPAIGPCHYTVREDVASQVRAALPFADRVLQPTGPESYVLDLPQANRELLIAAGVPQGAIVLSGLCTACHTDEFYSHRAEAGQTGRFGAIIGLSRR